MKVINNTAQHNIFKITLKQQTQITLSSDFDSGNLNKVEFVQPNLFYLTPANDCAGTQYQSLSKSWFYFTVGGVPSQFTIRFVIKNIHMLASVAKYSQVYNSVYKYKGEDWKRVQNCLLIPKQSETELHFEHRFEKNIQTSFSFSYPYSYQECQSALHQYEKQFRLNKEIYFNNEIIIKTPEQRNINLVTISSQEGKQLIKQSKINESLFGFGNRAQKFRANKKVVLITARVHPGETPASYSMNGIIKFLLSKDARALMLRKFFVFMLIPMLNPDGVYHGHYRMDIYNQNLNRFYINPDPQKQPAPFAVKYLAQYLTIENRLFFFIDLHSHAGKKGNFFYGNSFDELSQQVQTQLFSKILSLNCVNFQYQNCNFTKKQMTSKDRNEDLTKEGCSRVVLHKIANLIYSYTLQCGYHMSSYLNDLPLPVNSHRKVEGAGYIYDEYDNIKSNIYSQNIPYFNPGIYENVGKSIVISILDLFNKNPYSRIPNSTYKDIETIKRDITNQLLKTNDKVKKQETNKFIYRSKKQNESEVTQSLMVQFQKQGVFEMRKPKLRLVHKITQRNAKSKQIPKRNIRIRDYTISKKSSKPPTII